jgi:hypothetical protein
MPEIKFETKITGDQEVVARLAGIEQKLDALGRTGPESAKKTEDHSRRLQAAPLQALNPSVEP